MALPKPKETPNLILDFMGDAGRTPFDLKLFKSLRPIYFIWVPIPLIPNTPPEHIETGYQPEFGIITLYDLALFPEWFLRFLTPLFLKVKEILPFLVVTGYSDMY